MKVYLHHDDEGWMAHCHNRCFNVKRRYAKYFVDTLRQSTLVSLLIQIAEIPLLTGDIIDTHIEPLIIYLWIRERINTSLQLHPHPWVIMSHLYNELLPPLYKNAMRYSTVFHIVTIDSVTYKIPAYFWCDIIYYTRQCPRHVKKFYKFI